MGNFCGYCDLFCSKRWASLMTRENSLETTAGGRPLFSAHLCILSFSKWTPRQLNRVKLPALILFGFPPSRFASCFVEVTWLGPFSQRAGMFEISCTTINGFEENSFSKNRSNVGPVTTMHEVLGPRLALQSPRMVTWLGTSSLRRSGNSSRSYTSFPGSMGECEISQRFHVSRFVVDGRCMML